MCHARTAAMGCEKMMFDELVVVLDLVLDAPLQTLRSAGGCLLPNRGATIRLLEMPQTLWPLRGNVPRVFATTGWPGPAPNWLGPGVS